MDLSVYDRSTGLMSPAPSNRKPSIPTDEDIPRTPQPQSPPASGHSQRSNHSATFELPPSPAKANHNIRAAALVPPPTAPAALSSPAPTSDSTSTRLLKVIQDPTQRRKFHSYLKCRFSEENLEFYVDVKKYHLAWESSQWDEDQPGQGQVQGQGANVMQLAFHIYGQYLRETSQKAVNVPRELLQHVEERLFPNDSFAKTMPLDLFDNIQQHCFGLMAHGNVNDFLRHLVAEEEARKKHLGELESLEDDKQSHPTLVSHARMASLEALGVPGRRTSVENRSRSHERKQSISSMSSTSTMSEQAWNPMASRSSSDDASPRPKTARGASRDDDPDSDDTKKSAQSRQSQRSKERTYTHVESREEHQPRITHYDPPPWQTSPKIQPHRPQVSSPSPSSSPSQAYIYPSYPHSYSHQQPHPIYPSQDSFSRAPIQTPFSASTDYRRPSTSSNFSEDYEDRDQRRGSTETFAGALARRLRSKSSAGRESQKSEQDSRPQTAKTLDFSKSTPSLLLRRTTTKKSKEEKLREKEEKRRIKELRRDEPPLPAMDFVNMFGPALHSGPIKPKLSSTAKPVMNIAPRPVLHPNEQGAPSGTTPSWIAPTTPHVKTGKDSMSFRFSRHKKTDSVLLPSTPTPRINEYVQSLHRHADSSSSFSSIGTPPPSGSANNDMAPRQIKVFNVVTGESKTVSM